MGTTFSPFSKDSLRISGVSSSTWVHLKCKAHSALPQHPVLWVTIFMPAHLMGKLLAHCSTSSPLSLPAKLRRCLEIPVGPDVAVGHHILPLFPDLEAVVPVQGQPFFQRLWWWWSWWLPFWQPLPLWLGWGAPQP